MKKKILVALVVLGSLSAASSAFAFSTSEIFYGSAFVIAANDCPNLGVQKGEFLSIGADEAGFSINQITGQNFTPVLSIAVPSQGAYVFDPSVGFPLSNEIRTKTLDISRDQATFNITISQRNESSTAPCVLDACADFGPCVITTQ